MGDPFAGVRFASPLIIKPEAPAKCHIFRLDMRNHANGKTMYRCRCGAIYRNGPTGWTVTENKGPYRGVCHANRP